MRAKFKFNINGIKIGEATAENAIIEVESDFSVKEVKELVGVIKELPNDIFECYKNFKACDKQVQEDEAAEKVHPNECNNEILEDVQA